MAASAVSGLAALVVVVAVVTAPVWVPLVFGQNPKSCTCGYNGSVYCTCRY